MRQGNFEVGWTGQGADYNDAQDFLFQWQTANKQENYARFSNPEYDRLLDEASVTSDVAERAQLLAQAEQLLLREMPVLPLYFGVSKNLVNETRGKNVQTNNPNRELDRDFENAVMQAE
jgi:oligopeptide transport system substrate-binding protein